MSSTIIPRRCQYCWTMFWPKSQYHDYCAECMPVIREHGDGSTQRMRKFLGSAFSGNQSDDPGNSVFETIQRAWLEREWKPNGYVYFLGGHGYCKIGRAKRVTSRVKQLAIQLPWPVELVHVIPCADYAKSESALHRYFADQRANGEWFFLSDSDLEFIKAIKRMKGDEMDTTPQDET